MALMVVSLRNAPATSSLPTPFQPGLRAAGSLAMADHTLLLAVESMVDEMPTVISWLVEPLLRDFTYSSCRLFIM